MSDISKVHGFGFAFGRQQTITPITPPPPPPPPAVASLKFNVAANSQYLPLLAL